MASPTPIRCFWRRSPKTVDGQGSLRSVDVIFSWANVPVPMPSTEHTFDLVLDESRIPDYWRKIPRTSLTEGNATPKGFKILIPTKTGFWCRENIVSQRLRGCSLVGKVQDIAGHSQIFCQPHKENFDAAALYSLVAESVCFIEVAESHLSLQERLDLLEIQLVNRLSLPLILPQPVERQTLALLEGRPNWSVGEWVYRAAEELQIDLVVLDRDGHWMQRKIQGEATNSSWRVSFIPIDMTLDSKLPQRIVDAVQGQNISGIVSFSDLYILAASQTAERLGLPASSSTMLETCRDKFTTRALDSPPGFQCYRLDGYEAVEKLLHDFGAVDEISYPLILKPCAGSGSEGVHKVDSHDTLLLSAAFACRGRFGTTLTLETYVEGPEVDANFVLCDGVPIFFEASDDFPVMAEVQVQTTTWDANFMETDMFLPSSLPKVELSVLYQSMLKILFKLGARNGVFHMEARIKDSAMEYAVREGNLLELGPKKLSNINEYTKPTAILIENNCRPPTMVCTYATAYTYGVDYYALHLLFALGDIERARCLAQPFLAGAQFHCDCVMIPVETGGICASHDPVEDLRARRPDLMLNVIKGECLFRHGEQVPDPSTGVLTWIAYFLVAADSRRVVLEIAQGIRDNFVCRVDVH